MKWCYVKIYACKQQQQQKQRKKFGKLYMHKRESEKKIPSLRENELGCEHQKIDRDKVVENDAAKQK